MKYINQINSLLVITAVAMVVYTFSNTYWKSATSPPEKLQIEKLAPSTPLEVRPNPVPDQGSGPLSPRQDATGLPPDVESEEEMPAGDPDVTPVIPPDPNRGITNVIPRPPQTAPTRSAPTTRPPLTRPNRGIFAPSQGGNRRAPLVNRNPAVGRPGVLGGGTKKDAGDDPNPPVRSSIPEQNPPR